MNKKQGFKEEALWHSHKEEVADTVITEKGNAKQGKVRELNLAQIIAPTPYSVFALCKLYESFQQN